MLSQLVEFIREHYSTTEIIPLHSPVFGVEEENLVVDTIRSTFVSSVGAYVDQFETQLAQYCGAEKAVAVVNGTAALHIALRLVGVNSGDLVLTQPLSFVATANAISYCGAQPVFLDIDANTLSLSPIAVSEWLTEQAFLDDEGICRHRATRSVVRACVPMHTFGHPADLDGLANICAQWNIALVEDAAEALGSFRNGRHVGTWGAASALSFNGNKIITTGGGGAVLADTTAAAWIKHMTTTAKVAERQDFTHDDVGYNYRLPNLNAALGCAQMNRLPAYVQEKRRLASHYRDLMRGSTYQFIDEPLGTQSNFWLNAILAEDRQARDAMLTKTQAHGIQTRPAWRLLHQQPMYESALRGELTVAEEIAERLVNLPSSVRRSAVK
ncbi:MAG: LegC family aminotransferase [Natronospirillum sp.]